MGINWNYITEGSEDGSTGGIVPQYTKVAAFGSGIPVTAQITSTTHTILAEVPNFKITDYKGCSLIIQALWSFPANAGMFIGNWVNNNRVQGYWPGISTTNTSYHQVGIMMLGNTTITGNYAATSPGVNTTAYMSWPYGTGDNKFYFVACWTERSTVASVTLLGYNIVVCKP